MKKVVLATVMCLMSAPALAEVPEGMTIDRRACDYLVAYTPDAGVNADYQAGVDVTGKPVVEADITPNVITPPAVYTFDLTVDIAEYLGINHPAGLEGKAAIGTVTVKDGKAFFNGQPLEGEAEAALRAICVKRRSAVTVK